MRKPILLAIAVMLSVASFSQKSASSNDTGNGFYSMDKGADKTHEKTYTFPQAKKDSATIQTPLLSYADFLELQNFLKDKFTVKEYEIVINWIDAKYNQRIIEYNSKLK